MLRFEVNLETSSFLSILAEAFLLGSSLAVIIVVVLSQRDHSFQNNIPGSHRILPFHIQVISVSFNVVDVLLGLGL
jgi:hypothetical protein